jgi:hypothetical protein
LWLSSPIDFNDPFDMGARVIVQGSKHDRDARIRRLVEARMPHASPDEKRRKFLEFAGHSPEEIVRIWSDAYEHYRRVTGVCSFAGDPRSILMWSHYGNDHTGLCLQFDISRDPRTFLKAISVKYSSEYPHVNWVEETAEQLKVSLLRKYEGWRYENEWRIVIPDGAHKRERFRPEALTGLIAGCRAPEGIRALARNLASERQQRGFPRLQLYFATQHSSR